jgi:simple sugar transport system ATP-binding protein
MATEATPVGSGASVHGEVVLSAITKRFGDVLANDAVTVTIARGEVLGLLGENGAGKSTLMNILSGAYPADEGEILIDGKPVVVRSPRDALELGFGMVHQHFRVIDGLTVAENLHVGWDETPGWHRRRGELEDRAGAVIERFGLGLDPRTPVWQLSVGEKQRLEILKMLARDVRFLILDEPTAVLTPQESERLFGFVRELRNDGAAVVFISHKLPEVLAIADRITVMRKGAKVAEREIDGTLDAQEITRLMVGADVPRVDTARTASTGSPALEVTNLSARDERGLPALRDVSLLVRSGEILGIAGVAGNGQRDLIDVLAGIRQVDGGTLRIGNQDLTNARPDRIARAGLGLVPEDRMGGGLAGTETIWRNAILKIYRQRRFGRAWNLRGAPAREYARTLAASVQLSTDAVDRPARTLSGGHAQRLLTGRELDVATAVLVLAYPTRGLDVAAVASLHRAILGARDRGLAVLLVSEDLSELLDLADRIAVLYGGRVQGTLERSDATMSELGRLMGGVADAA